jgi:hypothetical protein
MSHGWGARQWTLQLKQLFNVLYVSMLRSPSRPLLTSAVHKHRRSLIRTDDLLRQDVNHVPISTHVRAQPNC